MPAFGRVQPAVAKISKAHWLPFRGEMTRIGSRKEVGSMTLAEKIAALRGERKLSQGDLAEKLDVSRQSVSKWETGQAVPELDKIIRLADVFGVTVDELVRDRVIPDVEDAPKAETVPEAKPEPQIIYVERRLARTQVAGVVLLVLGLLGVILGAAISGNSGSYMAMVGAGMVILGLPFLLARKHPFPFFQKELLSRLLCHGQMHVVNRVECTAHNANLSHLHPL